MAPSVAGTAELTLGRGTPAQREFRLGQVTALDQDVWMMNATRRAGLDKAALTAPLKNIEDASALDSYLTMVVTTILQAGVVFDVLAGVLVEKDTQWSAEGAQDIALFLAKLTDPEEKKTVLGLLAQVIHSFTSSGQKS